MSRTPLVSVIAVNYNNAPYLIEALQSIAEQDYANFELIIVDDHSSDGSPELIRNWLSNYRGVSRFISHTQNRGVCSAGNTGFRVAEGKYVCGIATDDVWLPGAISKQVAFFESLGEDVGMIFGDAMVMGENGDPLPGSFIDQFCGSRPIPSGHIFDRLIQRNFIPAMTVMVRRSIFDAVGYFDEELAYEDFDMWLRIAKLRRVMFQNEILARYRKRPGSLTSTITHERWLSDYARIFAKHQDTRREESAWPISQRCIT